MGNDFPTGNCRILTGKKVIAQKFGANTRELIHQVTRMHKETTIQGPNNKTIRSTFGTTIQIKFKFRTYSKQIDLTSHLLHFSYEKELSLSDLQLSLAMYQLKRKGEKHEDLYLN